MATATRVRDAQTAASIREKVALRLRVNTIHAARRKTIGVDVEDSTATAELVVDGAEIDLLDAKLTEERSTHDARLNSDIENALLHDVGGHTLERDHLLAIRIEVALAAILIAFVRGAPLLRVGRVVFLALGHLGGYLGLEASGARSAVARDGKQGRNGHELGVASAVASDVGRVHASGDDLALVNNDAADGSLVGHERKASLWVNISRCTKERKQGQDSPCPKLHAYAFGAQHVQPARPGRQCSGR